ncbi:amino acid adenylation domain-containing protein [Bacillus sp. ISL-51]|uniref:non-ribosomal peptide synthetase n=1 Tax=Bacteria TaxID=2 RepID=UPI001BE6CCB5|nr:MULTISPECIES: non-ribosomal peptide synthetase [Bacteria]MBT2575230.1 amino acid adenylation domain-containing protein [Bacillus sp. ISL-51]MBT2633523.1 amino acid adenylation domain-containing protein [Bacillus sp. ISL-26]MBT2714041.1 amino acid adenylation domain-containing protein [Pseudomonas sp. ISL-88]
MKRDMNESGLLKPSVSYGKPLRLSADQPMTIPEVLHKTAAAAGDTKGITYIQPDGTEVYQTYSGLRKIALSIVKGLRQSGVKAADEVILQLSDNSQLIPAFWGCVLAGAIPVPLAAAPAYTEMNSGTQKLKDAWTLLNKPFVITSREMLPEMTEWAMEQKLAGFCALAAEDLSAADMVTDWHHPRPKDLAMLLLTSGSTGTPKAVMLSHENIVCMVKGNIQMQGYTSDDVTFNWMPFDHVGGIGMLHLRDVYLGCKEINIPSESILMDPLKWLDLIDHYRASVTWAPNFAFGLLADFAEDIQTRNWDLSSMRYMLNGGEAAVAKVGRRIMELLEPHGLPANAIRPAWGMSETSSGVIFSDEFTRANTSDEDRFVEIGLPIPGFNMRITDERNQVVEEGEIGRFQVSGLTVTSGYYERPDLNESVFTEDGWFETGDLGFLREGRLTITGRTKDAIIINGVNFYSHAIESAVEELPEIETSFTAACAVRPNQSTTDKLAIFFVTSVQLDDNRMAKLLQTIHQHVTQKVGVTPDYLLPVAKEDIPKTAIGKIQRTQLKTSFEQGQFDSLHKKRQGADISESAAAEKEIQNECIRLLKNELEIADELIDADTPFQSLGVNSIKMMRLARSIEKTYHIRLTARELHQHPTIGALAAYTAEKAPDQLNPAQPAPSVETEKKQTALPLSEVQKGLWTLQKMSPESSAYHVPLCFRFISVIDKEKLKQAFQLVLEQHPMLKRVVKETNGDFYLMEAQYPFGLSEVDISEVKESDIPAFIRKKVKEPFVKESGPLLRVQLFSKSDTEHFLLTVIHHIIFDGVSSITFIHSLLDHYQALLQGKEDDQSVSSVTHYDFAAWEKRYLAGEESKASRSYWKEQLGGTLPDLQLPSMRTSQMAPELAEDTYTRRLPDRLLHGLTSFAKAHSTNLSTVLLSCYMVLLSKYTDKEDIVVGMPAMVRPEERFDGVIGHFLNMLPIRNRVNRKEPFAQLVKKVQDTVLDGLDHSFYPFPKMVRDVNVKPQQIGSPIFTTAFFYQNFLQNTSYQSMLDQYEEFSCEFVKDIHQEGEYDLVFELWEEKSGMDLTMKYSTELFDEAGVSRLFDQFVHAAESLTGQADLPLGDISLLPKEEEELILHTWNETSREYPDVCFHELFERQAAKTPDACAVVYEKETLTYRELDEKSTKLALFLQAHGAVPDGLIGIYTDRSLEMAVGLLGILKAGGAYVPLDPSYPADRLEYMIADSGITMALTTADLQDSLNWSSVQAVAVDRDWHEIERTVAERTALKRLVTPDDLAYVIYTSGSTGKPKGVMIPHRALTNFLTSMAQEPGLSSEDKLLAVTTYCFDIAALELYLPLIKGAECNICKTEDTKDAKKLKELIKEYKPTIMQATPFTWKMLFHSGWTNEERMKILCGGEALSEQLKQQFLNTGSEAWNMFGPTETTIWSAVQRISESESALTIGRPIANTRIYILDSQLKPVPPGVSGELCIAGDGLARGYFNKPELTEKAFVNHELERDSKLYKTGDMARWLPDGRIEYMGRMDSQVKIRGYRIELGDIESKLNAHPDVQESVVVVNSHTGSERLAAYYIAQNGKSLLSAKELRNHLKKALPAYMVPAYFIRLEELPLTPNGKVDRKRLARRGLTENPAETKAVSSSDIQHTVLAIWRDVLKNSEIEPDDRFFDAGGDSLLAVTAADRITQELHCEFSVTELFEYATVKGISRYIADQKPKEAALSAVPHKKTRSDSRKRPSHDLPDYYEDSVAVIGISCEFPGAENHFEFWDNLKEGKESIAFFTKEELRRFGVSEELADHPGFVAAKSAIDGKEMFDPGFFGFSPKDAEFMDPQLRMLLLHSWKAIEDAGYVSKEIPETSVYMSASNNSYRNLLPAETTEQLETPDGYVSWVLAQSGTIPTMISHKLGLKGPSYFVHANCSSSLIGLHSAYKSLQSGESKYALVGGATLHTEANAGYVHQPGLNFSSDGHIKAFDASADGMMGGEGAAAVLLKNAADAVRDGDHIYALLRGIGVNNDGADKVGFYAPSVKGQAEVIQKVIDQTGINPETVSYVEAHGTGTKLGDPIELSALGSVYGQYTDQKQFCGIGSVKTNVGHLDTAAGMAGCIKVVMSLYHQELAPSINYKEPNPNLDLENSSFYVVEEKKALSREINTHRMALSSFGLGGTNTHAIFEQYQPSSRQEDWKGPFIIPMSARKKERLKEYARQLLAFLQTNETTDADLADAAYTFQIGREAMEQRAVFITSSIAELTQQLGDFVNDKPSIKGCFRGEKQQAKDIAWLSDDDDSAELIEKWLAKGKGNKLAEMWSKGVDINWHKLYKDKHPNRISMPVYPFAKEPYWPKKAERKTPAAQAGISALHPLVHQNTSDLSQQRFSSLFTGSEFFLTDHVVREKAVLPGAAYMEMAYEAVKRALGGLLEDDERITLRHTVWLKPIVVHEQQRQVHIALFPEEDGIISYDIYSVNENEEVLHSQGRAEIIKADKHPKADLAALQSRCAADKLEPAAFYQEGRSRGMFHGKAFQGIKAAFIGEKEVLAELQLPSSVSHTGGQFTLHPSMIDSAVQTATICIMQEFAGHKLILPFALEHLEVVKRCTPNMWAHARFSEGYQSGDPVQKADIDLFDDTGAVCVKMRGFSTRVLEGDTESIQTSSVSEKIMFEPVWKEAELSQASGLHADEHLVILCEEARHANGDIASGLKDAGLLMLDGAGKTAAERFQTYAQTIAERIQQMMGEKRKGRILIQTVISADGSQQLFAGLSGLLKTAELEYGKLTCQLIEISAIEEMPAIAQKLKNDSQRPQDKHIRYKGEKRYVKAWKEIQPALETDAVWKDEGVYLITGGTGSLGLMFAKEITNRVKQPRLILTGRSDVNEEKQREISMLQQAGANVVYKKLDAADRQANEALIQEIMSQFGKLNGIIHGAGVIKDRFLIQKTSQEFQEVLAPKVLGAAYLDEASKDCELDFFVLFSSVSGSLGNIGQADYAAGNAFMDAYAAYRDSLAAVGLRHGKTISFNWPLWKEGGMQAGAETEQMMAKTFGMVPLQTETGLAAFYEGMAHTKPHLFAAEGMAAKLKQTFLPVSEPESPEEKHTAASAVSESNWHDPLTQMVSSILKVSREDIDIDTELSEYGFDSVSFTVFTNQLNEAHQLELAPTIFFEYGTIRSLAEYLTDEVKAELSSAVRDPEDGKPRQALHTSLTGMVSEILKVDREDIDIDTELSEYGFDSVSFTVFTNRINETHQLELAPTIFFEYGTINSLAGHLAKEYHGRFAETKPKEVSVQEHPEAQKPKAAKRKRFASVITAKAETPKLTKPRFEPVAIVGISGRFPGAKDVDEFWGNLKEGKDCITTIPKGRWDWEAFDGDPNLEENKTNIRWGGFIDGIAEFDPLFFGISPREAQYLDPQQRLLLTFAWGAIEDAGCKPESLSGTNTGVFIGTGNTGYKDLFTRAGLPLEGHAATGSMIPSVGPNRLSYLLNLHGPSEPVETACSSSLVAIHRAVSAMQNGECDMAIAGGINTILTEEAHISYSKAGMLSKDGKCKTFSKDANGYVRGEGAGMIMLKKLADAERDGNPIYGIIRGTAENHGGRANTLTSPNPKQQADLLVNAYRKAEVDPSTVTYIEAHGTGTELGDPIEINGLKAAFQELSKTNEESEAADHRCGIGSVKSNIGHLELAAGISGVMKVLLQMKHKTLVKSLHAETINPYIQLKDSPFYIVQENQEWKALTDKNGKIIPRRAGVSSFGIGGVNAHIVIEEYIPEEAGHSVHKVNPDNPAIILLSAKSKAKLHEQAVQLLEEIHKKPYTDKDLAAIAYTLQTGRDEMEERLAFLAATMSELETKLYAFTENQQDAQGLYTGQSRNKETFALFTADEDMDIVIDAWIRKRKYAKLAEVWVKGGVINWNRLYDDNRPRLISLPSYPFAKDTYWLPEHNKKHQPHIEKRSKSVLTKQWELSPAEYREPSTSPVAIFADRETMNLAEEVSAHFPNHRIIGTEELSAEYDWKSFAGVIDLLGAAKEDHGDMIGMKWLQKLIEHGRKDGITLLCVTKELESLGIKGAAQTTGAGRAGLYRMLACEYSHLVSRHLDLEASLKSSQVAKQIADEFNVRSDDAEICWRDGMRYRAVLKASENHDLHEERRTDFPEDHVLFITGGTRGIGLLCARHFTEHYGVKKLVLTGRETLPPRNEWTGGLKGAPASVREKIQAVLELEAKGVKVHVLSVPLADEAVLKQELNHIKQTLGPIGGVIHCAGVTDKETLAFIRKTDEDIQRVLEPKIDGLQALYNVFSGEPLKFFVLFSSVSAAIPALSAGQADYAMANAYMDYFANAFRELSPIVSIQWPNWKETGMGEVTNKAYKDSGLYSITNAEGLQLLDGILARSIRGAVLPAVSNPELWKPEQFMRRSKQVVHEKSPADQKPAGKIADPAEDHARLAKKTEAWLTELFSQELRIDQDQLETDVLFQDYGVDSIILAQLLQRINRSLEASLDPSILYEYPTIQSFAVWLIEGYAESLSGLFKMETPEPASKAQAEREGEKPAAALQEESFDGGPHGEDIAVVGMSCRFPGADTLEAYWSILAEGRSSIRPVPPERWGSETPYYAGVLDGIREFDPEFFLLPEEDVKAMDPQALAALEECLNLWYHAGYTPEEIKGEPIGVYLGGRSRHKPGEENLLDAKNPIVAVGQNYLAANLSQYFDMRGPSLVLDTACSSALVGMNMAVQALLTGEIKAAVVGGVSLFESEETHKLFDQRGILSEASAFHVFDERADGVVLGEGVGMVLLKTVKQALKDGDSIYAVVKAASVNNDGRTAGPATPSLDAQKAVMKAALAKSGKQPEDISYIEANGSGTVVTDLLELKAIQSVYRPQDAGPLGIGSVKPNIGHPLCAEGIASFIKVVLMLKERSFVPFLSGEQEHAHFDREKANIIFSRALTEWPSSIPAAGINCFADGGTNAHIIIEAWQENGERKVKRQPLTPPVLKKRLISPDSREQIKEKTAANIWDTYEVEV